MMGESLLSSGRISVLLNAETLPDGRPWVLEFMWADAGIADVSLLRRMAKANPLRWTCGSPAEIAVQLRKKDGKDAKREVVLRTKGEESSERTFASPYKASKWIEEAAERRCGVRGAENELGDEPEPEDAEGSSGGSQRRQQRPVVSTRAAAGRASANVALVLTTTAEGEAVFAAAQGDDPRAGGGSSGDGGPAGRMPRHSQSVPEAVAGHASEPVRPINSHLTAPPPSPMPIRISRPRAHHCPRLLPNCTGACAPLCGAHQHAAGPEPREHGRRRHDRAHVQVRKTRSRPTDNNARTLAQLTEGPRATVLLSRPHVQSLFGESFVLRSPGEKVSKNRQFL
jgi:hypothetical protein